MLKVWGRRSSFNVQKVLWLIGELGLAHEHVAVGGDFGGLGDPAFLAMNPHGRIPVVQDGGLAVWESHAILRYLAARHGDARFWTEDPAVRAGVDAWMDWAQTALLPDFLGGVFWGLYRTPPARQDQAAIARSLARCAAHFRLLDRQLEGRAFLLGDDPTLADIPIGAALYRWFELQIDRPPTPNVEAWYERLQRRPAYREHVMVAFEELRGRLDF